MPLPSSLTPLTDSIVAQITSMNNLFGSQDYAQSDQAAFNPMTYATPAPFGEHAITPERDVEILNQKINELYAPPLDHELTPEDMERLRKEKEQRDEDKRKAIMNDYAGPGQLPTPPGTSGYGPIGQAIYDVFQPEPPGTDPMSLRPGDLFRQFRQGIVSDESLAAIRENPLSPQALGAYAQGAIMLSGGKGREQTPFGKPGAVPNELWASWKTVKPGSHQTAVPGKAGAYGETRVDNAGNHFQEIGTHESGEGEYVIVKPVGKPGSGEEFYQKFQEDMRVPPEQMTGDPKKVELQQMLQQLNSQQDLYDLLQLGKQAYKPNDFMQWDKLKLKDFMDQAKIVQEAYPQSVLKKHLGLKEQQDAPNKFGAFFEKPPDWKPGDKPPMWDELNSHDHSEIMDKFGFKNVDNAAKEWNDAVAKFDATHNPPQQDAEQKAYWEEFGKKHEEAQVPPEPGGLGKIPLWHELSPEGQNKFFKDGGFKDKLDAAMNWDHAAGIHNQSLKPEEPPPPKKPPEGQPPEEPPVSPLHKELRHNAWLEWEQKTGQTRPPDWTQKLPPEEHPDIDWEMEGRPPPDFTQNTSDLWWREPATATWEV
jgi:hypothetical protein